MSLSTQTSPKRMEMSFISRAVSLNGSAVPTFNPPELKQEGPAVERPDPPACSPTVWGSPDRKVRSVHERPSVVDVVLGRRCGRNDYVRIDLAIDRREGGRQGHRAATVVHPLRHVDVDYAALHELGCTLGAKVHGCNVDRVLEMKCGNRG